MSSYHVEFVTSNESPNPWKAATVAWEEIILSRILVVTNDFSGKSYEVRLATGEILCPECGRDVNDFINDDNCENCLVTDDRDNDWS